MKLLFGTGNQYKLLLMKERLKVFPKIEILSPQELAIKIEIKEDGKTPEENAIKKARAYYEVSHLPTIAEDSGLYIEKFSKDEQPGLHVRRIDGKEHVDDEEIVNWYLNKLEKYGGESIAQYVTGVCIIDENGKIWTKTVPETPFLMTTKKNMIPTIPGGVLDCISYDIENQKYFNERTNQERQIHFKKLDRSYQELVRNALIGLEE